MKELTKEELQSFIGKTVYVLNSNRGRIRNREADFFVATSKEALMEFADSIRDSFPGEGFELFAEEIVVDDLSRFNPMFCGDCPFFEIVDMDAKVSMYNLCEKREEAINKIEDFYSENNALFVAIKEDGSPFRIPVGNVQVTVSFFTKEEDAKALEGDFVATHELEYWVAEPPCDATIFSVDGEIIYGGEMAEGAMGAWNQYVIDKDSIPEIIGDKQLHMLAADDGSGAVMRCLRLPIFFISDAALKEFAQNNKSEMTHTFYDMTITRSDGIRIAAHGTRYVFVDDDEKRYVFNIWDLIDYLDERDASEEPEVRYADTPVPEDNELRDVIYELLDYCDVKEQVDEDDEHEDPLGNTFFKEPVNEQEIIDWEKENKVSIPESYKQWLRFTGRCNIDGTTAGFFPPSDFTSEYTPDDLVSIGGIIGDGEMICFSKTTGEIVSFFEGEIRTEYGTFDKVIKEVIRLMGKREMSVTDQQMDRYHRAIDIFKKRLEETKDEDERIELEYLITGFEMDIKRAKILSGIRNLEEAKVNYKANTEGREDPEHIKEVLDGLDEGIQEDKEELRLHDEEMDKLYADNEKLIRDRKRNR